MSATAGTSAIKPTSGAGAAANAGARVAFIGHPNTARFRGWLIGDMVALGHRVAVLAGDDHKLRPAIERLGAAFVPISMDRTGINPIRDLADLIALARRLRAERPDVVLTHGTKSNLIGTTAAGLAGVPRIFVMVEGLGYAFVEAPSLRRSVLRMLLVPMFASILRMARTIFVLNPDDARLLRRLGLEGRSRPIVVVDGTGIDLDAFAFAAPVIDGPLKVLMIARLLREKGIAEYVDAAHRLRQRGVACRLQLLGPADSNPGAIDPLGAGFASSAIEYLGACEDVRPHLRACSVFCLPSYREGLPRAGLEALAIGRPIVTTDVPGCRELVIDGVNGFLVPPRDGNALATAISRLVDQPQRLHVMARASRALAEARFDVRTVNAVMLATMGLAGSGSSPAPLAARDAPIEPVAIKGDRS